MKLTTALSSVAALMVLSSTSSLLVEAGTGSGSTDFKGWANYKHLRPRDAPPPAQVSPIPNGDGKAIQASIQTQIRADVVAVTNEFSALPVEAQNLLKTALSNQLKQSIYKQTPQEQLTAIKNSVNAAFNKVQKDMGDILTNNITDITDASDLQALKNCIQLIVEMGGRTAENGNCLTTSGYTLDSLRDQFNMFVDQNTFLAPANKVNDAKDAINEYLDSVTLVPATEDLIRAAAVSLQNVVLTTAAKERDATIKSFNCFLNALQTISDIPIAERQLRCAMGDGNVDGSALGDMEEAYQARVNQYAGVLPPILANQVQRIGMEALSLNLGSYDYTVRESINTAIESAVAATSGESATVVTHLIDCLNTIYDDTPDDVCHPNQDPEILEHNANIVRNYLAQFASTLPKHLVENLQASMEQQLGSAEGPEADQMRDQLQKLFEQASLGSEYEVCENNFIDCMIDVSVNGSASTQCYDQKSAACAALPPMSPEALNDSGNPYAAILEGLAGDGSWGGAKRKGRRSAKKLHSHQKRFI